jgi:hypothetical protein
LLFRGDKWVIPGRSVSLVREEVVPSRLALARRIGDAIKRQKSSFYENISK